MRVLQILRAPIGGLFRHVRDLTQGLAERGHEVGVAIDSTSSDALTEGKLAELAPVVPLGIHRFPMPRLFGPGDVTTPRAIARVAENLGIEVLHGHGAKGGLYARLARSRGRIAIYTPHGGVLHFSPRSPSGIAFGAIERAMVSRTDIIVFESHFARAAYERQIVVPKCPVAVMHNGVTEDEFVPVTPAPDAADFVFVGELRDLKGIFVLADAMAKLPPSTTLLMAGDGPARAALEARIAALGLTPRITLAGAQPARAMFARGRAVIVPSLAESLPYIVLEAAAAGLPVISTKVGGIAEIFGPTAGSLLPPGDADALAQAMSRVLADPATAAKEAMQRLAHVRAGFSVDAMTDGIEAIYRQALAAARH